ncbi:MAG: Fic family protein, partial [Isosphaeraceae bacterium]
SEYYRQLDYASKSGGDMIPFIAYAVQGLVDGLKSQLDFIWEEHWDIVWRNYVHDLFAEKTNKAEIRQYQLALELGAHGDWVRIQDIDNISPKLAKFYANKTSKTLQRDIQQLIELGLATREEKRVRARRELILAFLRPRKADTI